MTAKALEKKIYREIPIAKKMGIRVQSVGRTMKFKVSHAKNKNHLGTAFGGSLIGSCALCCWAWLSMYLVDHKLQGHVVIRKNSSRFFKGVNRDFVVEAMSPKLQELSKLKKGLKKKGYGKVNMRANVKVAGQVMTEFSGEYVAIAGTKLRKLKS